MEKKRLFTLILIAAIVSMMCTASLHLPTSSSLAEKFLWDPPEVERNPTPLTSQSSDKTTTRGPVPFYKIAERITFDELVDFVKNGNFTVYLPTWMPGQIRLRAIYHSGHLVMLSYSEGEITDYRYDNVTIEISLWHYRIPSKDELEQLVERLNKRLGVNRAKVLDVNGVRGVLDEAAPWGDPELQELYGPSPYAYFWYQNHYYAVSCTPPITTDQLVEIIKSMRPLIP